MLGIQKKVGAAVAPNDCVAMEERRALGRHITIRNKCLLAAARYWAFQLSTKSQLVIALSDAETYHPLDAIKIVHGVANGTEAWAGQNRYVGTAAKCSCARQWARIKIMGAHQKYLTDVGLNAAYATWHVE